MKILSTPNFEENEKFYLQKKKYKKIDRDIETVIDELEKGNLVGVRLEGLNIPEDTAVYKVRIANSSANVGKSHGFRLIYYLAIADEIYLLAIYSKKDDIRVVSDKRIEQLIEILLRPEEE